MESPGPGMILRKSRRGQYSLNTFQMNVRLDRGLHRRAEKRAEELGVNFVDYIRSIIEDDTRNIPLTEEDYLILAARVRHEKELREMREQLQE